jgi:hypothetical protein
MQKKNEGKLQKTAIDFWEKKNVAISGWSIRNSTNVVSDDILSTLMTHTHTHTFKVGISTP